MQCLWKGGLFAQVLYPRGCSPQGAFREGVTAKLKFSRSFSVATARGGNWAVRQGVQGCMQGKTIPTKPAVKVVCGADTPLRTYT